MHNMNAEPQTGSITINFASEWHRLPFHLARGPADPAPRIDATTDVAIDSATDVAIDSATEAPLADLSVEVSYG